MKLSMQRTTFNRISKLVTDANNMINIVKNVEHRENSRTQSFRDVVGLAMIDCNDDEVVITVDEKALLEVLDEYAVYNRTIIAGIAGMAVSAKAMLENIKKVTTTAEINLREKYNIPLEEKSFEDTEGEENIESDVVYRFINKDTIECVGPNGDLYTTHYKSLKV